MTDQSHEIEYQLIGSILKDGKIYSRVKDIVSADNFHSTICQDIYSAMCRVDTAGLTIDAVTVGDQLQRDCKLNTILHETFSGRGALSSIRGLGNPKNAESYAHNVQDYWGKRESNELASKIAYWSQNGRRFVDIAADARKMFDAIELRIGTGEYGTMSAREAASVTYDQTVKASQGLITFLQTGLIDLDAWFRMRPSDLTIIAGRPGTGKTALMVTIALNVARGKVRKQQIGRVLFISMEMSVEQVTARFLSQISGIPATRILDGKLTQEEWSKFNDAVEEFEKLPIDINDIPALSVSQIRAKARKSLRNGQNDLLIVDYLQLATSGEKKNNRVEEVGAITRGLKVLAGETGMNVIAGAQLSRAIEQRAEKRPILADLRESGNIEQDANNVLFIHKDESEEKTIRRLIVGKHRNGPTSQDVGDVLVAWIPETMRFENSSYRIETFGNKSRDRIGA